MPATEVLTRRGEYPRREKIDLEIDALSPIEIAHRVHAVHPICEISRSVDNDAYYLLTPAAPNARILGEGITPLSAWKSALRKIMLDEGRP